MGSIKFLIESYGYFCRMAIKNQYLSKYFTPVIHILFWILLFFLPHLIRFSAGGVKFSDSIQTRFLISNFLLVVFFYINAYLYYPKIYKRRGLLLYLTALITTVFIFINASPWLDRQLNLNKKPETENTSTYKRDTPEKPRKKRSKEGYIYFVLFPYLFITGISISYRIVRDASKDEKIRKERENENLKTELAFLRSQVSPHFMFNVLNTFVSMARKKSDMMEPSLIKLSHIMRYMLYENNDERISLEKEVEYLRNYIDLQLLRFGDDLNLDLNLSKNLEGYELEPMLLISFVENAFKHGIGMVEHPFISIQLSVDPASNWLKFIVENSVSPEESAKDKASGIGLSNMRRRLELLYKDRYKLETLQNGTTFISTLNILLK